MADPKDDPTDNPKKKTVAELSAALEAALAELARRDAEAARAEELRAAREKERADAIAAKNKAKAAGVAPPPAKLLGQIPVYLEDEPQDVIDRARALMAGQVPVDRARRFKIDARLRLPATWPDGSPNKLAARLGPEPPLGAEFDADDMPLRERIDYAAQGAIVAIG